MHPLWLFAGVDRGRSLGRGLLGVGQAARDPAIPVPTLEAAPPMVLAFSQRKIVTRVVPRRVNASVRAASALLALAGGVGAVTVSPPAGAMEVTGLAPVVVASSTAVPQLLSFARRSVTYRTLPMRRPAPVGRSLVLLAGGPVTVNVPATAMTLAGLAPVVVSTAGNVAAPPTGALALSGLVPTVVSTANDRDLVLLASVRAPKRAPVRATTRRTAWIPLDRPAGPVTVAVPAGSLTLAGLAPAVVSGGAGNTIAPPAGTLVLAGLTPTVQVTYDLFVPPRYRNLRSVPGPRRITWAMLTIPDVPGVIAVPRGQLTLAGLAPTVVVTGSGNTIAPPAGTLVVAGLNPSVVSTVDMGVPGGSRLVRVPGKRLHRGADRRWFLMLTAGGARTVAVPLGNLNLSGLAPSVLNGGSLTIAPPVGALTLSGLAPGVIVGGNNSVAVPAGALTLSGLAPIVVASGNQSVAPPSAALTLAGLNPLVQVGGPQTISVPLGSIVLAGLQPGVLSPRNVAVPLGTMTLSGLAPVVAITANRFVVPPVGNLNLAGLTPSLVLSTNQTIGVPTGGLLVQGFAPFLNIPQTVLVPKAALVLSGFAPAISVTVTGNNTYGPRYILQRIRARLFSVAHNPPRLFTVARARARTWSVNFMAIRVFEDKDPSEKVKLAFDFTIDLPAGVTLTGTPVVNVTTVDGIDASPTAILNGAAVFDVTNKKIIQPVRDGLDGVTYNVSVWCATTDAQLALELDGDLPVVKRKRP